MSSASAIASAQTEPPREDDYRALSALGLGGAYVGFGAWTWLAWYRDQEKLPAFEVAGDGWFAVDTYAGGADKLGHAWAALLLTRLGSDLLDAGGWSQPAASAISSGLCLGALTLVEVNDGYYTEFSPGDLTMDLAGVGAALAFRHVPGLDDAFDFRVQWFPSRDFRRHPGANFAEDYSGQTYLLAFKPRVLSAIRNSTGALLFAQFINPVVGFESRNYVPIQAPGERVRHSQTLFVGLTLDVQAVIDFSAPNRSVWGGVGHTMFEYVNLPFSTLPLASGSRTESTFVPSE